MTSPFVPVNEPLLNGNEKKYLEECIDSGWISSEGPFVGRFEDGLAAYFGRKHAIAVTNGTVAIDIAVDALGLREGDEVIMPTFTIISCITALVRKKCVPVFVDQDADTWNMDVSQIESRITPRTRAIMAVHIYGLPVDMDPLLALAARYGLKVIEDAAEMHGQEYNGKKCGGFGDISTVSFYPNKLITTGEGGMIFTDDDALADRCRSLRNLCFEPQRRFLHHELGYNARMTNLQAAIGLAQLERIDDFLQRKRAVGARYQQGLHAIDSIQLPLLATSYARNCYWVFGIVLRSAAGMNAAQAMTRLAESGIGTRPFFLGMHQQPVLYALGIGGGARFPVAENLSEYGFYIPSGLSLTDEQVDRVVAVMKSIFSH